MQKDLLSCFAPHLGEELWATVFGNIDTIAYEPWPTYDEAMLVEDTVTVIAQINGKVRGKFDMPVGSSDDELKEKALALQNVQRQLEGKEVKKIIVVKGKVVNIVAK